MWLIFIPGYKGTKKGKKYCYMQFAFTVMAFVNVLIAWVLHNILPSPYFEGDYTEILLILHQEYRLYLFTMIACIVSIILSVVGCLFCLIKIARKKLAEMPHPICIGVISILISAALCFGVWTYSYDNMVAYREDLRQAEVGNFSTGIITISSIREENPLHLMAGVTRIIVGTPAQLVEDGIEFIPGGRNVNYYIPNALVYRIDIEGIRPLGSFNPRTSDIKDWRFYEIHFTDNFNVIARIDMIDAFME